jgi:sulfur-oxidizing protein SoxZ
MVSGVNPQVELPKSVVSGDAIPIQVRLSHLMESGLRKDSDGNVIPRSIIHRFTCDFNGRSVIDVTMDTAMSENPYFEFNATVDESGVFTFTWYDDDGAVYVETKDITVV